MSSPRGCCSPRNSLAEMMDRNGRRGARCRLRSQDSWLRRRLPASVRRHGGPACRTTEPKTSIQGAMRHPTSPTRTAPSSAPSRPKTRTTAATGQSGRCKPPTSRGSRPAPDPTMASSALDATREPMSRRDQPRHGIPLIGLRRDTRQPRHRAIPPRHSTRPKARRQPGRREAPTPGRADRGCVMLLQSSPRGEADAEAAAPRVCRASRGTADKANSVPERVSRT